MNLDISHIYKSYSGQEVLNDVSFTVKSGEVLALSGESGCGKSTLLRVVAGLETPDAGAILLNGKDITHLAPEKRKFGFVFQNLSLFPHLNVHQNIAYAIPKKNQSASRLKSLLEMTGLNGFDRRYPHELSGGQQQRVALARALAIDPSLLILDEPFSSLDELLKTKIRAEVFDLLQSLGITTILVSHQATDAFLIADKLVVMKDGHVRQIGTPSSIYEQPSSAYVSDFFGASVIMKGRPVAGVGVETDFGTLNLNLSSSDETEIFIRPENIVLTDRNDFNLQGIVIKKEFKGPHDVLMITGKSGATISLETERCAIAVGEPIYMKVPAHKFQFFK